MPTKKKKKASDSRSQASGRRSVSQPRSPKPTELLAGVPAQSPNRDATSATRDATSATMDAQFAFLESQIALLQAQNAELSAELRAMHKERSQTPSAESKTQSAESKTQREEQDHSVQHSCAGDNGTWNSALAKAGPPAGNNTATFLQTWLDELQIMFENFAEIVPQLGNTVLPPADRRRLLGSGVRRYGFIEKTADVAEEYPQFWPSFVTDTGKLKELVNEIEAFRNLLVWFRYASRVVQDLLLLAGDDAFRLAGSYYATTRDGARRNVPEAGQVFQLLRLFWNRRRRTTEEPTEQELEREFNARMHGRKDGKIVIENESDSVVQGEKTIMDHTYRKPRGGCHQRNNSCHQRNNTVKGVERGTESIDRSPDRE